MTRDNEIDWQQIVKAHKQNIEAGWGISYSLKILAIKVECAYSTIEEYIKKVKEVFRGDNK